MVGKVYLYNYRDCGFGADGAAWVRLNKHGQSAWARRFRDAHAFDGPNDPLLKENMLIDDVVLTEQEAYALYALRMADGLE